MSMLLNPNYVVPGGPPGQPPTNFASIVWIRAIASTLYTSSAAGGGVAVTADADPVGFAVSQASSARCDSNTGATSRPLYKTAIVNSNSIMRFDGSNDFLAFNLRSGLDPTTPDDAAALLGANNFTYVCSLSVLAASTTSAATYPNHGVFHDSAGFVGLHIKNIDAGNCYMQAYLDDGGNKHADISVPKATFMVVGVKHDGSNIKIRINGGSWTSTACGNVSSTGGTMRNGGGGLAAFANIDLSEIATFKSILSDADLLDVEKYFGSRIGLTI